MAKLNSSFEMVVSEKGIVNGKSQYVPKGKVNVFYPTLADFGIDAEIKETTEDGFPVYVVESLDWLFSASLAAVRANARNKLEVVNGVVQCKEGLSIAETMEALIEVGTGGGNGAALAAIRELLADVRAYMVGLGKSSGVVAAIVGFVNKPETLALIDDASKKKKAGEYVAAFAATLSEEKLSKYSRRLQQVADACEATSALDASDF